MAVKEKKMIKYGNVYRVEIQRGEREKEREIRDGEKGGERERKAGVKVASFFCFARTPRCLP